MNRKENFHSHVLSNPDLITVLFAGTSRNPRGKARWAPLPTHQDSLCHHLSATGLHRSTQSGERHWPTLPCPSGGIRAMNSAETSGKELERQFGWEQTVRAFRQKSQENFIQISSDYLQSVTKYEAPANAIEQKSTKQKAALSGVQGTAGSV